MIWQGVIAVAAGLALWYWLWFSFRPDSDGSWTRSAVKTGATGLLALGFGIGGAPAALVAGLALGSLGDLALSRPGTRWFLAGMAAFAAGHLAYAGWFAAMSQRMAQNMTGDQAGAVSLVAGGILVLLLASTEVWLAPRTGTLKGPVRAYVLVIGAMCAAALMLPAVGGAGPLVQIGAALFMLSDLILALRMFVVRGPAGAAVLGALVWPLYWAGQVMILMGGSLFAVLSSG